jgi:ketosteroid isomerase-like protein
MEIEKIVRSAFEAVDRSDAKALVSLMTDDAVFRFSNNPEVTGKTNIVPFLDGFFASIQKTKHDHIEFWEIPDGVVMNGRVTYTRLDGSAYSCWFSNTFKLKGGKIIEYLIFVDNSRLYDN